MLNNKMRRMLCVAGGLLLASQSVFASVVDGINEFSAPFSSDWGVPEVGWFYTPTFDYQLDGIETKFRTSLGRVIDLELYQNFVPGVGGTLMRTGSFVPVGEQFTGATFANLQMVGGESYFVGFKNTFELGVNYTTDVSATNLGDVYYSFNPGDDFGNAQSGVFAQPILRFLGQSGSVAEPATLLLLGLGVAALALVRTRRLRRL